MLNNFSLIEKSSIMENNLYLKVGMEKKYSILELAAFQMLIQVKQRNKS